LDINLLALSIGLGLVVSLLFSELFGLAAGGLVVPGYMALYLTSPVDVIATITAALFTFFLVRIASTFIIIYGRRRTASMILVGYVVGVLVNIGIATAIEAFEGTALLTQPDDAALLAKVGRETIEAGVIGYIVPGLIAIWLDRQGVGPTLAALLTSAVVVRLILILAVPEELLWFEAGNDPQSTFAEVGDR
jgi:poly-gamma-glutamate biosynthesis protein PgsC/CapC